MSRPVPPGRPLAPGRAALASAALLASWVLTLPAYAQESASATLEAHRRGWQALDRAAATLGGWERLAALEALTAWMSGEEVNRFQSPSAEPPFAALPIRLAVVIDASGKRLGADATVTWPNFTQHVRRVAGPSYGTIAWGDESESRVDSTLVAADLEPMARRLPHYLLLAARSRPAAVRHLGSTTLDGHSRELVQVAGTEGELLTLYLEPETGRIAAHERLEGRSYNVLFVELGDGLVAVDAPLDEGACRRALSAVRQVTGPLPVRWVIPTHHHSDHAGGVTAFVAEGAKVLTTRGNVGLFTEVVGATRRLTEDPARRPPPSTLSIETVDRGHRVLAAGDRAIHVHDVGPNPHADEHLVVHVPWAELVFQGDLVRFPEEGIEPARPQARALMRWIEREGLEGVTIAGTHGRDGTVDELRAALAAAGH